MHRFLDADLLRQTLVSRSTISWVTAWFEAATSMWYGF